MKISHDDLEAIAKIYDPEAWEEKWPSWWRGQQPKDFTEDQLKERWERRSRQRRDTARSKVRSWYLTINHAGFAITRKGN